MLYKTTNTTAFKVNTITTDKFNSNHLEIIFENTITRESFSYLSLLFDCLLYSSNKYKEHKLLERKKEYLYNMNISSNNVRIGNTVITSISCDYLIDKYTDDDLLENVLELLKELLFKPDIQNGRFNEETFNVVKNQLIAKLDLINNNHKQSSILSALALVEEGSPISYNSTGDKNIIEEITPKKLFVFYKELFEASKISIYYIGNTESKKVAELCKDYLPFKSINVKKYKYYSSPLFNKKLTKMYVKTHLKETHLVKIYGFNNLTEYESNYVVPIFNLLWGAGSLNSKLYNNMRMKNALCYNVATYYQKYDALLIAHTAVEKGDVRCANQVFKKCLLSMKKGYISSEELKKAKALVVDGLRMIENNNVYLVSNFLFKNLIGLKDTDTRIEELKKVEIKDLVRVAKKMYLLVSYRMGE